MKKYFSVGNLSVRDSDFLKGIGILMIAFHNFFHHITPFFGENEFDFNIQRVISYWSGIISNPLNFIDLTFSFLGHYGVQLFILISGYGLMKAYGNRNISWGEFMRRRLNKLYPTYIVALIFVASFFYLYNDTLFPFIEYFLKLTFVTNFIPGKIFSLNGPWWFYGMIVELYMIFPLLKNTAKKFPRYGLLSVAVLSYIVMLIWGDWFISVDENLHYHFIGNLPVFIFGMALASKDKIKINRWWILIAALVFIAGNFNGKIFYFSHLSIAVLLFAAGIGLKNKLKEKSRLKRIIYFYGEISMYLYAVHGFLRPLFIDPANLIKNPYLRPFTTILAAIAFVLFSTVAALFVRWIVNNYLKIIHNLAPVITGFVKKRKIITGLSDFLKRYFQIAIAFIITIFLIRYFEFYLLKSSHSDINYFFPQLIINSMRDVLMGIAMAGIFLLPFTIISLSGKKIATGIYVFLNIILIIAYIGFIFYFNTTLIPLDQVILAYSPEGLMNIVKSSDSDNTLAYSAILSFIIIYLLLIYKTGKIKFSIPATFFTALITIAAAIMHHGFYTDINNFQNENEYYYSTNKLAYFVRKIVKNHNDFDYKMEKNIDKKIKIYQSYYPNRKYVSTVNPYLYIKKTPETLEKYFRKTDNGKPPNIVFILVESLSPPVSGKYSDYASFTPFTDSLAERSLYWPNTLSTTGRTFGVLPAVLGSLPMGGKKALLDYEHHIPRFIDIVSILKKNGYDSRFFYGGWSHFNNMNEYLEISGVNEIITDFPDYRKIPENKKGFSWGYPDGAVFDGSFPHIDSLKPYVSIYLTLSTHNPFKLNNPEKYQKKAQKIISGVDNPDKVKAMSDKLNEVSTFVYFDESLRMFFEKYKKRSDYKNTIFIITGDHKTAVFSGKNDISNYHVPLIIYSPLLKTHREFQPVASHLNISPTITSLLHNSYSLKVPSYFIFTGKQLDTGALWESKGDQLFIRNSRETNQIIYNNYYLSGDILFEVEPGLNLKKIKNDSIENALKQRRDIIYKVADYAINFNKIIPQSMYFRQINGIKISSFISDFEKITSEDSIFGKTITNRISLSGSNSICSEGLEYFSIMPDTKINDNYSMIYVKISFDIFVENNGNPEPLLVVSEVKNGIGEFWSGDNIIKQNNINKGEWRKIDFIKTIPRKKIKQDSELKIYFWQQDPGAVIYIDNIKATVIGRPND